MATEVIKIIDPDEGAGWDYNSLTSWDAGEAADIVTADEQHTAKCRSTSGTDDTNLVFTRATWVTDPTRYIKIWTDPAESHRHDGKWNDSKYVIDNAAASSCMTDFPLYVQIIGIQFNVDSTGAVTRRGIRCHTNAGYGEVVIDKCILRMSTGGTGTEYGMIFNGNNDTNRLAVYVTNCIAYDFDGSAISAGFCGSSYTNSYFYNNTAIDCYLGFQRAAGTTYAKNCAAMGCTDGFSGIFTSSTNNASDIASDAPGSNPQTGNIVFENEGANDFHLGSGDSVARGNGTDLSSDGNWPFDDDIDNETRSAWDIGADEYSGGTTHEAVATVVGKGLLGAIAAALLLASANATVTGKGLLGDVTAHMDWSGDATVVGKGLLGDITPNVDYTSPEATVVGKGLLGVIDGDIISASAGRTVPTYLKHEGSVLFDGTSGTEVWVGFYVYASDTYNATVGRPAIINHATTNWLQIGRGSVYNSLGICRENADTGNRLSVGLGGYVTQLSVKGAVAVDDTIYGRAFYGTQASYFETIGASTGLGEGWICGIAKSTNTTGVGTIKAWLFPWKV